MVDGSNPLEDGWLARIRRLEALAATGLNYTAAEYDRERYQEMREIARAMLADLGSVPVERIAALVEDPDRGYATPKIDVRAAVFDRPRSAPGEARILLVREAVDGRWTLPGGFADVGFSAVENVTKEVAEEAGIDVRVERLFALRHKARHRYRPDVRDFYKLFFLCERLDGAEPAAAHETTAVDWFRRNALPPLSTGRTIEADVHAAFAHRSDATRPLELD